MTWASVGVALGSAALGASSESKARKRQEAMERNAAAFEADRNQRVKLAQGKIDSVFDSPARQAQRNQFALSLREYLGQNLARQHKDTARNTKFGLAKQGLIGSSVQNDANKRLQREYGEATIANERDVQRNVADLRGQDEQSRMALRNMATQGLGIATAGRRANEATMANLGNQELTARAGMIGDYFKGATGAWKAAQERNEMRRGYGYTGRRGDLWGNT